MGGFCHIYYWGIFNVLAQFLRFIAEKIIHQEFCGGN
jgi:hypothetical protein